MQLIRQAAKAIEDQLAATGLTGPVLDLLVHIHDHEDGAPTIKEVCEELGIAPSTATDLLDRAERGGWIRRVRADEDRRLIRVTLACPERFEPVYTQYRDFEVAIPPAVRAWLQQIVDIREALKAVG